MSKKSKHFKDKPFVYYEWLLKTTDIKDKDEDFDITIDGADFIDAYDTKNYDLLQVFNEGIKSGEKKEDYGKSWIISLKKIYNEAEFDYTYTDWYPSKGFYSEIAESINTFDNYDDVPKYIIEQSDKLKKEFQMNTTNIFKTEDHFRESFFENKGSSFNEKENNLMDFFWDFYDDLFKVIGREVIGTVTNKQEEKLREQIAEQEEKEIKKIKEIKIDEIDTKIPYYIEKAKTKMGKPQIGTLKTLLKKLIRTNSGVKTELEFLYELLQDGFKIVIQNKPIFTGKKVLGSYTENYKLSRGHITNDQQYFDYNKALFDFAIQLWKYHNKPIIDETNVEFDNYIERIKNFRGNFIDKGKILKEIENAYNEKSIDFREKEYLIWLFKKK